MAIQATMTFAMNILYMYCLLQLNYSMNTAECWKQVICAQILRCRPRRHHEYRHFRIRLRLCQIRELLHRPTRILALLPHSLRGALEGLPLLPSERDQTVQSQSVSR